MYGYGTGLSALITKLLVQPATRKEILRRITAGVQRAWGIRRETTHRLDESNPVAPGAALCEVWGLLAGPVLYAHTRREVRRRANASGMPELVPAAGVGWAVGVVETRRCDSRSGAEQARATVSGGRTRSARRRVPGIFAEPHDNGGED